MSDEFVRGVEQFNRGDYFVAHETWEALWLHARGPDKIFLQGTIQLAAAFHHWRRGNARGALSLLRASRDKLQSLPAVYRGIRVDLLRSEAASWAELLAANPGRDAGSLPRIEWAEGPDAPPAS